MKILIDMNLSPLWAPFLAGQLPEAIGDTVVRAIKAASIHLEAGALVTIHPHQHRVRILPL